MVVHAGKSTKSHKATLEGLHVKPECQALSVASGRQLIIAWYSFFLNVDTPYYDNLTSKYRVLAILSI
jgi:hypothetical protein